MADSVTPLAAKQAPAPIKANVPEAKSLTLAQRMAAIRADAFGVGKTDIKMEYEGKSYMIKGHTVDAVLSEMRPLLVRHGVGLTPLLRERTYNGNRCDVLIDFEFQNLDDESQVKIVPWAGAGTDKSDKGFSKAGTNALKEMLKKVFLVTDRDDAKEEEEKVDHETDEGVSRKALEAEREHNKKLYEEKANLVRGLFKSAETLADVERLEREHKAWINKTPEAMRVFFTDAIAKRKAHFKANEPETPPTKEEMEAADLLLAEREGEQEVWEDER